MSILALMFVLYFAPSLVASGRQHPNSVGIWVVNLFTGWTVVGWVVCLAWAFSTPRPVLLYPAVFALPAGALGQPPGWASASGVPTPVCPACFRPLLAEGSYCVMCGAATVPRAV